ncbi:hypothetical protein [Demequina maris]|uniref:hypothetical protein n=1 Tax=Demequina maris TaxID=1638982 RepID=UPI000782FFE4|nr:hypothetical protein [Demequina maris]
MSELRDMFHERDARLAASLRDADEFDVPGARTVVKRRRRVRAAVTSAASVLVVAAVGAGAYALVPDRAPAPVAVTPSASATPTPTPSISASPTATPSPERTLDDPGFAGTVTESDHLPSAEAITPEVWASAGSGWSLVTYQERWYDGEDWPTGPQVVYLISPHGERYQLIELPGDVTYEVYGWEPGATTATAVRTSGEGLEPEAFSTFGTLDLVTGAYSDGTEAIPEGTGWWSRLTLDEAGAPVFRAGSLGLDSPSMYFTVDGGSTAAWQPAADLPDALSQVQNDGDWCLLRTSFPDGSRAFDCADGDHTSLLQLEADGGTTVLHSGSYSESLGATGAATVVGDHLVVEAGQAGYDWCPTGLYELDGGTLKEVPGTGDEVHPGPSIWRFAGASGTVLYTEVTAGCGGDSSPRVLVAADLDTGEWTELVPFPAAGIDIVDSVTSVVVVP